MVLFSLYGSLILFLQRLKFPKVLKLTVTVYLIISDHLFLVIDGLLDLFFENKTGFKKSQVNKAIFLCQINYQQKDLIHGTEQLL